MMLGGVEVLQVFLGCFVGSENKIHGCEFLGQMCRFVIWQRLLVVSGVLLCLSSVCIPVCVSENVVHLVLVCVCVCVCVCAFK